MTLSLRYVIEALLLDDTRAPLALFDSLFGLNKDMLDEYVQYFFNIPKGETVSRIDFYSHIGNLNTDGEEFRIKHQVFDGGWESIDIALNRGRNVNIEEVAKEGYARASVFALHKLRSRLNQGYDSFSYADKADPKIQEVKDILAILKDAAKLFPKDDTGIGDVEQLVFDFTKQVDSLSETSEIYHSDFVGATVSDTGMMESGVVAIEDYDDIVADAKDLREIVNKKGNEIQQITLEEIDNSSKKD